MPLACLRHLVPFFVFALGEEFHTGLNATEPEEGEEDVDLAAGKVKEHPEDKKYNLKTIHREEHQGKTKLVKNHVLSTSRKGKTLYSSAHSKSWLRGGDKFNPEAYARNRHSVILAPQENRQSILDRKVEKIRPMQAGVMQVHIAPLHRRAPIKVDPRPEWEQPKDELDHELEMRYDELAVEFRVTDQAGIDVIQLYLPERQDCRGSGRNVICSGYEFMTEPKKDFNASQGEGPGFGGCVFRRHNEVGKEKKHMTLPSDSKQTAEEIDFDKDILSCMVNNRIGDGETDMPRRAGLEIVFKKTFVPKRAPEDKDGENLFRYFIIMIQNPNQSPVYPRLDAHGTDANSYIFQWGKRAQGYKSEVIAFPAQDIKPIWTCTYSGWVKNKECSAKCGGGVWFTTRRLLHLPPRKEDPRYDPLLLSKCDQALEKREPCNEFLCDADCKLGKWSPDGGCSAPCGGGYQTYRRHIIQAPRGVGRACPAWNDPRRVMYKPCNKPETQQLCEGTCEDRDEEFTYTGPCSEYCGPGGVRYKFRQVPRKHLAKKDFDINTEVEVIKEYNETDVYGLKHNEPIWEKGKVISVISPQKGIYKVELTIDKSKKQIEFHKYEMRELLSNGDCEKIDDRDCCGDNWQQGEKKDKCDKLFQRIGGSGEGCVPSIYDEKTCLSKQMTSDGGRDSKDGCHTVFEVERCGTPTCLDFEVHHAQAHVAPLADMWHEVAIVFKLKNYAKIVEVRAPNGFSFGTIEDAPCVLRYPMVQPNGRPAKLTFTTSFECSVSGPNGRHAVFKFKNPLEPTPDPPKDGDEVTWEPKYVVEIWVRHPPCNARAPPESVCDYPSDKLPLPGSRRWSLGIWTEFPGVWEEYEHNGYLLHASALKDRWTPGGQPGKAQRR